MCLGTTRRHCRHHSHPLVRPPRPARIHSAQACAGGGVERPVLVHLVDGATEPQPTDAETVGALASVGDGVMLAARLVDAPTNYMHTDVQ